MSAGVSDVFVASVHPDTGKCEWIRSFGGPGLDVAGGIAVDPQGDVVVTGSFSDEVNFGDGPLLSAGSTDIFLLKLSSAGTFRWALRFGGSGTDLGVDVAVGPNRTILTTGRFEGSFLIGSVRITSAGAEDIFVARFNPGRANVWAKRFGSTGSDRGSGVTVDANGNVLLTGHVGGTTSFGGTPLAGGTFVARLRANGDHVWSVGEADQILRNATADDVSVDGEGNAFVAGTRTSPLVNAVTVKKLRFSNGSLLWEKSFFTDNPDAFGIEVDRERANVVVTGIFEGALNFGGATLESAGLADVFVAKLSGEDGSHRWSKRFGGTERDVGLGIAVSPTDGAVAVTGGFSGTVDFGSGPLRSLGEVDAFVVKLRNPE